MIPLWCTLALTSALALSFYDVAKKHAVQENSVMPVLFFSTLCGSVFYLLLTAVTGDLPAAFRLSGVHYGLVWMKSLLVSVSWTFVFYAMRELPLSIAAPIRASSPLWTFLGGLFLFHEVPTLLQALGMASIFTGYFIFSVAGRMEGIAFARSKGIYLIAIGTLLGAASALFDKYLLNTVGIPRGGLQLYFSLDLVVIFGLAWGIRTLFGQKHPFRWRWTIPATGILLIIADALYFHAVSEPGIKISILSLFRRTSCIVAFAFGIFYFRDANWKIKAGALVLILLGVFLCAR